MTAKQEDEEQNCQELLAEDEGGSFRRRLSHVQLSRLEKSLIEDYESNVSTRKFIVGDVCLDVRRGGGETGGTDDRKDTIIVTAKPKVGRKRQSLPNRQAYKPEPKVSVPILIVDTSSQSGLKEPPTIGRPDVAGAREDPSNQDRALKKVYDCRHCKIERVSRLHFEQESHFRHLSECIDPQLCMSRFPQQMFPILHFDKETTPTSDTSVEAVSTERISERRVSCSSEEEKDSQNQEDFEVIEEVEYTVEVSDTNNKMFIVPEASKHSNCLMPLSCTDDGPKRPKFGESLDKVQETRWPVELHYSGSDDKLIVMKSFSSSMNPKNCRQPPGTLWLRVFN